ncbi:F0F1 ATP synthase subunit delta [Nitrococcus mobilis]|uniref:F0F1 ATP synthase subunit delta n=1 Tax=Nitrococcus mobilis TaxID=35797 RepID=UPI000326712A|nr:F0F1 ATP synthase subunit delta [Nitrococcus mobilis]
MTDRSTARPYAIAAFRQAQEEGAVERWSEMLRLFRAVVSDPAMAEIIANPRVERTKLIELISNIGGKTFAKTTHNFLKVLVYHGRLTLVPEIAELFEEQRRDEEGKARVEVVSAFKLSPTHADAIAQAMTKRLDREVDLTIRIDKSIIGGVIVRAGDLVIDASLRGRLQQLAQELS